MELMEWFWLTSESISRTHADFQCKMHCLRIRLREQIAHVWDHCLDLNNSVAFARKPRMILTCLDDGARWIALNVGVSEMRNQKNVSPTRAHVDCVMRDHFYGVSAFLRFDA